MHSYVGNVINTKRKSNVGSNIMESPEKKSKITNSTNINNDLRDSIKQELLNKDINFDDNNDVKLIHEENILEKVIRYNLSNSLDIFDNLFGDNYEE